MTTALRIVLSLAVAALLVALLFVWSDAAPRDVARALGALEPGVYALALGVQALIYPLRALRFRWLLTRDRRPGMGRLLPVTAAHILAANVLPAKLGEATLVLYLRRVGAVPAAHGLAVLVVSRLLDLAVVAGGLAAACLTLGLSGAHDAPWLVPLGTLLVVPSLLCAWLGARGERVVAVAAAVLRALRLDRTRLGARVLAFSGRLRAAFVELSPRGLLLGALTTVPIWALVFLFYAILARGLGLADLSLAEAVFGAGLAILANQLPINGFAGFGAQDVGWVAGFTALGVAREAATASGLGAHLVYLFNIALFGLAGHVGMGMVARPERGDGPSDGASESKSR